MGDFTPAEPTLTDALEQLAAHISPEDYRATVVVRPGHPACLSVTNRRATRLSEDIYVGHGWFWWPWAERLGPVTEPAAAAATIARVLRADPELARG